jgi:fido (protein-threonine AMPylation protein)
VASDVEMMAVPTTLDELVELLRSRHATLLEGRPEKNPGVFKDRPNRAGSTAFVAPHLVQGTLARGLAQLERLHDAFSRAVMMLFVVSEVHPFDDGNGRVARVMMNAELHAAAESRIVIPTVYRSEYLSGLRALTHNAQPRPLVTVLDFAQRYTQAIDFSSFDRARAQLEETHAFVPPDEATARGIRLELPESR